MRLRVLIEWNDDFCTESEMGYDSIHDRQGMVRLATSLMNASIGEINEKENRYRKSVTVRDTEAIFLPVVVQVSKPKGNLL